VTTSLLIQFDQALQAAVEAALAAENLRHTAAQGCVYLNRSEPPGENEPLPIVVIQSGPSSETHDEGHVIATHQRKITIEIVAACPQGLNPSVALDPICQAVRRACLQVRATVPGVLSTLAPVEAGAPVAQDGLAIGRWDYDVKQITSQLDLGTTPYP